MEIKRRILDFLRIRGPSLPIQISSEIKVNSLFTSAFLSELLNEKEIKMSFMKIGSSSLYHLPGQESRLENFSQHLKSKEKDAFIMLQSNKFLRDSELDPAIRVALREIKDFAIPFQRENEIFWRYFLEKEENYKKLEPPKQEIKEEVIETPKEIEKPKIEEIFEKKEEVKEEAEEVKEKIKKPKKIVPSEPNEFYEKVGKFLKKKGIEVLEEIEIKKREVLAIINVNSDLGKIKFFMFAIDKKQITTDDLLDSIKRAKPYNLPSAVFSTGKLHKKAEEYYQENNSMLKFNEI